METVSAIEGVVLSRLAILELRGLCLPLQCERTTCMILRGLHQILFRLGFVEHVRFRSPVFAAGARFPVSIGHAQPASD